MCVCRGRGATPGEKLGEMAVAVGRRQVSARALGVRRYDRRALRRCASPLPPLEPRTHARSLVLTPEGRSIRAVDVT